MKEDLLRIREIAAEKGSEFTPEQIINFMKQIKPDLEIIDEPGLVTWLKTHGDTSTG